MNYFSLYIKAIASEERAFEEREFQRNFQLFERKIKKYKMVMLVKERR